MDFISTGRWHRSLWPERLDTFNEMPYQGAITNAAWEVIGTSAPRLAVTPSGALGHVVDKEFSPIRRARSIMYAPEVIRVMAILHSFQHLTTVQAAALLDIERPEAQRIMDHLYSSGIVKRYSPVGVSDLDAMGDWAWTLDRKSWAARNWWQQCPQREYALITQGSDPLGYEAGSGSLAALRHNLILVDTAIRAWEASPGVVGVWGERWCQGLKFFRPGAESMRQIVGRATGDMALVTKDGTIIVVELVGKTSLSGYGRRDLAAKIQSWAVVAAFSDLPVKLLVLNSSNRSTVSEEEYADTITWGVNMAQRETISTNRQKEKMAEAVHYADCRDYFPEARVIESTFAEWEAIRISDRRHVPLAPADATLDTENPLILNTVASLVTPHWITRPMRSLPHR